MRNTQPEVKKNLTSPSPSSDGKVSINYNLTVTSVAFFWSMIETLYKRRKPKNETMITYLRHCHSNEGDNKVSSVTRTRNMHCSFSLWYCYLNGNSRIRSDNRLYESPHLRRLSDDYLASNLERKYRNVPWEHIRPAFDLRQLLRNGTSLAVLDPKYRIFYR